MSLLPPPPLTHSCLSVPHSGAKCRSGRRHPLHVVTALCPGTPVPAGAAGVCEGVSAVREDGLSSLRMISCCHVTRSRVWQVWGPARGCWHTSPQTWVLLATWRQVPELLQM